MRRKRSGTLKAFSAGQFVILADRRVVGRTLRAARVTGLAVMLELGTTAEV